APTSRMAAAATFKNTRIEFGPPSSSRHELMRTYIRVVAEACRCARARVTKCDCTKEKGVARGKRTPWSAPDHWGMREGARSCPEGWGSRKGTPIVRSGSLEEASRFGKRDKLELSLRPPAGAATSPVCSCSEASLSFGAGAPRPSL